MDYIFIDKYRQLFSEHIEQAIDYVKNLKEEDFKVKVNLFFNKIYFLFFTNKYFLC